MHPVACSQKNRHLVARERADTRQIETFLAHFLFGEVANNVVAEFVNLAHHIYARRVICNSAGCWQRMP